MDTPRTWRPADLGLLALLVLMPVLAGRAIGWSMDRPPGAAAALWLAYAVYEALFLYAVSRAAAPASFRIARAFAWRMQRQAAMQVLVFTLGVLAMVSMVDSVSAPAASSEDSAHAPVYGVLLLFLGQMMLVASISLAWWRCRAWIRSGGDIGAVVDGGYRRQRIDLPASAAASVVALDKHLARLAGKGGARYPARLVEARMAVEHTDADGQPVRILHWTLLAVRARLTVLPNGPGAAQLLIEYQLRAGLYRLELFPAPATVRSLMRHLHTQLAGPLASELALAGAVRKQDELRQQALESQLRILQAQIEPHFLFNTLANVRHLYRASAGEGEAMMDHLIQYLRSTLDELRSDTSTVRKEMELALHYLAIMKMRMGERLSYSFIQPDDVAGLAFPPAMLISLVENAIMHGLQHQPEGRLTISAAREGDHVRVTVLDNGPGFSGVQGSGVGLSNIRQRLEAIHGNEAWLEAGALAEGGFTASIVVPITVTASIESKHDYCHPG